MTTISTPWAVLLVKWAGTTDEPHSLDFYQQVFTTAGRGKHNVIDYWSDVSHGNVDLSGSRVLGWFTIDKRREDWQAEFNRAFAELQKDPGSAKKAAEVNRIRQEPVELAKQAVAQAKIDLGKFYGVIMLTNIDTDEWGLDRTVAYSADHFDMTNLCHEMGHGYGLAHSQDTSYQDYTDPWDVMSANNVSAISFPELDQVTARCGPILNAVNMDVLNWLEPSRVWSGSGTATIELRPLIRPDLPGFLAARVDGFLIEFRVPVSWDGGIGAACVQARSLVNGHSVLFPARSGMTAMRAGDVFMAGGQLEMAMFGYTAIHVTSIDIERQVAKITVERRPMDEGLRKFGLGQISVLHWLIDGVVGMGTQAHIVKVPPRQPTRTILSGLAISEIAQLLDDDKAREIANRAAMQIIAETARKELGRRS